MDCLFEIDDRDVLRGWAEARCRSRRGAPHQSGAAVAGLRFAFYGRTSTAEFQDPVTSWAWQREMAESVVVGRGVITSEFFDVGCSRRVPWVLRPRAAALLGQVQGVDCGFDVVVVGEFERAFTGRQFDEHGVSCPSGADPGRNRHRGGLGWNLRSVAVILGNPRYTGREVWRRHECATPGEGRRMVPAEWAVSKSLAHPALVSEADFVAVQQVRAVRENADGVARRYLLAGLIRCGLCGRLMDAHWVNGRAGYRCRHGHSSARPAPPDRLRNLYVREDTLLIELAQRLNVGGGRWCFTCGGGGGTSAVADNGDRSRPRRSEGGARDEI